MSLLNDGSDITEKRKLEHILINLEKNVNTTRSSGFDDLYLKHNAVPNIDMDKISTKTKFLNKTLNFPLLISAMTGGTRTAEKINGILAQAAEETGIAMAVGSQRAAIENPNLEYTYSIVRKKAPNAIIIGNIGAPQIAIKYGYSEIKRAIDMIDADAIAIHFNALQEAVQPEGDVKFSKVLERLDAIINKLEIPIIAKETGAGMSREDALLLASHNIKYIDIGGLGGTSFSAVEVYRAEKNGDNEKKHLGKLFWDWGIPTAISLIEVSSVDDVHIIASGGIRNGIDMCKALVLGAELVGIARPFLKPAYDGDLDAVKYKIKLLEKELRTCMFLIGAHNIDSLKEKDIIITGFVAEWIRARFGFENGNTLISKLANRTSTNIFK